MYKNIGCILSITFVIVILNCISAFALDSYQDVRIGLEYKYKNVQSVKISDTSINFGYTVNGVYSPEITLNSQSGFTVKCADSYYASTGEIYNSYQQAYSRALELSSSGIKATPASLSSYRWTVYCGGYSSSSEASVVNSNFQVISPNGKMTELTDGSNTVIISDNSYMYYQISSANSEAISLSDRKYRGRIEFNRTSGSITAVNVLNTEDYLRGTVPSEIPSKWNVEAIKAQTVASRTYTAKTFKHSQQGYDMCDSTHCQMYLGYNNESESVNQAIVETENQKIYYNNEFIDATYFSSSGGYTDDSENVWTNTMPYLRAVPDTYESECNIWTRTVTLNDLNSGLNKIGANIGNAVGMRIDATNSGGRVKELTILGTNGNTTLTKDSIKNFFTPSLDSNMFKINSDFNVPVSPSAPNVPNTPTSNNNSNIYIQADSSRLNKSLNSINVIGADNILKNAFNPLYALGANSQIVKYSKDFQSSNLNSANTVNSSNTFVLNGRGLGHGVGMSQFGAKGMAEAGMSYIDILKHYYTDVTIQ